MALIAKGMGPGATLAYLLGGPGLSLPSIMMLSAAFRKKKRSKKKVWTTCGGKFFLLS